MMIRGSVGVVTIIVYISNSDIIYIVAKVGVDIDCCIILMSDMCGDYGNNIAGITPTAYAAATDRIDRPIRVCAIGRLR